MMGLEIENLKLQNIAGVTADHLPTEGRIAFDVSDGTALHGQKNPHYGHTIVYFDGTAVRHVANIEWAEGTFVKQAVFGQISNDLLDTASALSTHIADNTRHITAAERANWNAAYSALFEADGSNAANVIDTWEEIKAFVANYNNSQDLATIISGLAPKATTLAGYGITDAKIVDGVITLGANTLTPLKTSDLNSTFYAPTTLGDDGEVLMVKTETSFNGGGGATSKKVLGYGKIKRVYTKTFAANNEETVWDITSVTGGIGEDVCVSVYVDADYPEVDPFGDTAWDLVSVDVRVKSTGVRMTFGVAPQNKRFKVVLVG